MGWFLSVASHCTYFARVAGIEHFTEHSVRPLHTFPCSTDLSGLAWALAVHDKIIVSNNLT
jgi:hypothetical protein